MKREREIRLTEAELTTIVNYLVDLKVYIMVDLWEKSKYPKTNEEKIEELTDQSVNVEAFLKKMVRR